MIDTWNSTIGVLFHAMMYHNFRAFSGSISDWWLRRGGTRGSTWEGKGMEGLLINTGDFRVGSRPSSPLAQVEISQQKVRLWHITMCCLAGMHCGGRNLVQCIDSNSTAIYLQRGIVRRHSLCGDIESQYIEMFLHHNSMCFLLMNVYKATLSLYCFSSIKETRCVR